MREGEHLKGKCIFKLCVLEIEIQQFCSKIRIVTVQQFTEEL